IVVSVMSAFAAKPGEPFTHRHTRRKASSRRGKRANHRDTENTENIRKSQRTREVTAVAQALHLFPIRPLCPIGPVVRDSYPQRIHTDATGAAKTTASITSSTPPKPGTTAEASLRRQSRLMSDSARSPTTAARPTTRPKLSADTGLLSTSQ